MNMTVGKTKRHRRFRQSLLYPLAVGGSPRYSVSVSVFVCLCLCQWSWIICDFR